MKIRISLLVWLYAFYAAATGKLAFLLSYLAAVAAHELAHAECARKRGYALTELRLMPYGAALVGEFEDVSPADEWRIAAVGPLASFLLAALSAALWWAVPAAYYFTHDFAMACLSLAAVNLLPAYPLDGGRIALALASARFGRARAYRVLRVIGMAVGVLVAGLFVLSCFYGANITLATMSAFLLLSALLPGAECRYGSLFTLARRHTRTKKGMCVREIMVSESAPARVLLRHFAEERYTEFRVVDGALNTLARFGEKELERLPAGTMAGSVGEVAAYIGAEMGRKAAKKPYKQEKRKESDKFTCIM